MKATLLALLTLGSLAMAADSQPLTIIPQVEGASAGNYDTIVFTLTNEGARTSILGSEKLTSTMTLSSIELAGRDKTEALKDWYPVITDATGLVVGFSRTPSTTRVVSHKTDWGWDYTRSFATFEDFENADLSGDSLVLTLGQGYRLYLGDSAQVMELYQALYGATLGITDPVTISSNYYTPGVIKVTTAGQYDAASANEYGLMNSGNIAGPTWAPLMGVTVQNNVPEPTTGTLSLLALAGLCIRRRK